MPNTGPFTFDVDVVSMHADLREQIDGTERQHTDDECFPSVHVEVDARAAE